jgi:hypothetical protein
LHDFEISASIVPGFQDIAQTDYDCLRIANGVFDGSVDAVSGESHISLTNLLQMTRSFMHNPKL